MQSEEHKAIVKACEAYMKKFDNVFMIVDFCRMNEEGEVIDDFIASAGELDVLEIMAEEVLSDIRKMKKKLV